MLGATVGLGGGRKIGEPEPLGSQGNAELNVPLQARERVCQGPLISLLAGKGVLESARGQVRARCQETALPRRLDPAALYIAVDEGERARLPSQTASRSPVKLGIALMSQLR